MVNFKLSEIANAVGGTLFGEDISVLGICTDTRKIEKGCAFLAIKGENFDGHLFVKNAAEAGALAAIVSSEPENTEIPYVLVDDTREAYIKIAAYHRKRFNIPVIGVTGSVGKTTTREMTAAALSSKRVHKNEGNFNNDIGLPAAVLTLTEDADLAVYEMGMNHFGEISRLSKMVMPDVGIISNVGISHVENLGSREGILKAKLEILDGMKENAPLVINIDNDMLSEVKYSNLITCGFNEKAMYRAVNWDISNDGTTVEIKTPKDSFEFFIPVIGTHFISNALQAIAAAEAVGINARQAAKDLASYKTVGMRQNIRKINGITVIEDCYNASPDSMRAGLDVLRLMGGRKIAALGDMLELGEMSREAHENVGKMAAEMGVDILLCVGEKSVYTVKTATANGIKEAYHFDSKAELSSRLCDIIKAGDTVLFKASRGMKLEEAIKELYNKIG